MYYCYNMKSTKPTCKFIFHTIKQCQPDDMGEHRGEVSNVHKDANIGSSTSLPAWLLSVATIVAYLATSSTLILLNKWIMVAKQFPYPMFLAGLGMAFSSGAASCYYKVFSTRTRKESKFASWLTYYRKVMPVGLFLAGSLATGNLTNLFLAVSLIQMLAV